MSDTIDAAVAALSSKVNPGDLDFSVRFDIEGEGSVRMDPDGVSPSDAEADLVMSADTDTFQGIMTGDVNPAGAVMSGRLSIDGDMGLAMRLGAILS